MRRRATQSWCLLVFQNSTYKLEPAIEKTIGFMGSKNFWCVRRNEQDTHARAAQTADGSGLLHRQISELDNADARRGAVAERAVHRGIAEIFISLGLRFLVASSPQRARSDTGRFYVIASALAAAVEERAADCFLESTNPTR